MNSTRKPHAAVCIPLPAQSHINPMLELAKLLHLSGFYITFVHTEFNYSILLKSKKSSSSSQNFADDFRFETIADGLPPSNQRGILDLPDFMCSNPCALQANIYDEDWMAVIPCGSTWMGRCGIQPQIVARFNITNKLSPPSHCFSSKSKALASPSSLFFSQIPMHVLFNSWSYKNSCQKRGARFTIRAEQDYYTVLGVSKNASKSEIKSVYSVALVCKCVEDGTKSKIHDSQEHV